MSEKIVDEESTPLSIVIPTALENVHYLSQCLDSLEHTAMPYQLIVVLNGEQPRSKAVAEAYDAEIVQFEENKGFAEAVNAGFDAATGDYLVGLNDDVILTHNWDIRLRHALDTFHKENHMPRAGLVGPCTNFAGGIQANPTEGLTPENLDDFAEKFHEQNSDQIVPYFIVTGFCFMVPRDFYDDMIERDGFFFDEENFPVGGAEDNDLCVRAIYNGWTPVVAGSVYVWHYGSRTLKKVGDDSHGVDNLFYLYEKWKPEGDQILGALYRVKFTREFQVEDFLLSIDKTYEFADRIYILDDQSTYWPEKEIEQYSDKIRKIERRDKKQVEGLDRQDLYRWAREDGCDWVISVDHDEVFEDKFDYDYAHRLMRNPNPACLQYVFHWYHLWNSPDYWRADGNRGFFTGARMCRVLPGFQVKPEAFHVGNIPSLPNGTHRFTSVRVRHYGQMRAEDRRRKYEFYEKHDKKKDEELIGNKDYSHLVDESNVIIQPWQEGNRVTLATIMKDEQTGLNRYLNQYWAFADEIVLVDTGSSDKSIEMAELFGCKVIKRDWKESFTKARNVYLKAASEDWILHLDIDEDLAELHKVRRMMDDPAADAYMFYVNNTMPSGKDGISETIRLVRNTGKWYYTGYVHETLDDAAKVNDVKLVRANARINHTGFMKGTERVKQKLKNYFRMNLRQIRDFPQDARGYFNAALHFIEGDYEEAGMWCLEKAVELNPNFVQALQSLGVNYANRAYQAFGRIKKVLPESNPMLGMVNRNLQYLDQIREKVEPIDKSHVTEVLMEEEIRPVAEAIAKRAER